MSANYTQFLETLSAVAGRDGVLTGADAAPYGKDWRGRYANEALAVVFPSDTQQVSEVVKLCVTNKISIVPQGGNTSLCGGSVPLAGPIPQIIINLSRMNRIRALDAINYTMTVEAGCKLESLYAAPEAVDRLFPLGLTAVAPHCEIGGNLSTNAGGINVLRYGTARNLVLGLEVVLPDGRIWDGLRSLRKDNTGYDLKQLFIGAEGTLGIITAAVVKLYPLPKSMAVACIAVQDPAVAVALLAHLRARCGDTIDAFEFISRTSLDLVLKHIPDAREPFGKKYEWLIVTRLTDVLPVALDDALRAALELFGAGIAEFEVTTDKAHAERWWKLRKNVAEAQKAEGISIKHDISVPLSRVAEFLAEADAALQAAFPGIRIVAFGHMGDGNIHYNASMPVAAQNKVFIQQHEQEVRRMVHDITAGLEGSVAAEHGVGQLKRNELPLYKSEVEMELMRNIKKTLDPQGLMNPGKVV